MKCTSAGCGCPGSIPVVPACCDEQGIELRGPRFVLGGCLGIREAELSSLSLLGHPGSLQHGRAQS